MEVKKLPKKKRTHKVFEKVKNLIQKLCKLIYTPEMGKISNSYKKNKEQNK